jgi:hypothetical protein
MKANGYQNVSDIPKGRFFAKDSLAQSAASEVEPSSGRVITHIVVPSATPLLGDENLPPVAMHVGDTVADAFT